MRSSWERRQRPLSERFYERIEFDTNGGCWLWAGAMPERTGYGTISSNGATVGAHRASYELHNGPIGPGLLVCHKCDVPACVNPAHLFLGTNSENIIDSVRKGRNKPLIGAKHPKAKISESDVPRILARLLRGESCAKIAADYGVTDCAINAIRRGKSWTHVTGLPKARRVVLPPKEIDDGQGGAGANNSRAEAA
jgi:hypothetical protein